MLMPTFPASYCMSHVIAECQKWCEVCCACLGFRSACFCFGKGLPRASTAAIDPSVSASQIALMSWVFGQESPSDVTALAVMHPEGADASGSAQLRCCAEQNATLSDGCCLNDIFVSVGARRHCRCRQPRAP